MASKQKNSKLKKKKAQTKQNDAESLQDIIEFVLCWPEAPVLLDAFSRPARKNTTDQNLLRQSFILTSSGKESKKQESEKARERENENPVPLKEHSPSPRTCHSLIGCSPSAELTSRGRQSTSSHKIPLAHAQIICLPLRTQDVSAIL
jgi:hypothetical protein